MGEVTREDIQKVPCCSERGRRRPCQSRCLVPMAAVGKLQKNGIMHQKTSPCEWRSPRSSSLRAAGAAAPAVNFLSRTEVYRCLFFFFSTDHWPGQSGLSVRKEAHQCKDTFLAGAAVEEVRCVGEWPLSPAPPCPGAVFQEGRAWSPHTLMAPLAQAPASFRAGPIGKQAMTSPLLGNT